MTMMYFVLIGAIGIIGFLVQNKMRSKFHQYGQVGLSNGLTGYQAAMKMLDHYGITNVEVLQGEGMLTDHYNPQTRTVHLSPEVYSGRSVAAASVAAHGCGHAV